MLFLAPSVFWCLVTFPGSQPKGGRRDPPRVLLPLWPTCPWMNGTRRKPWPHISPENACTSRKPKCELWILSLGFGESKINQYPSSIIVSDEPWSFHVRGSALTPLFSQIPENKLLFHAKNSSKNANAASHHNTIKSAWNWCVLNYIFKQSFTASTATVNTTTPSTKQNNNADN